MANDFSSSMNEAAAKFLLRALKALGIAIKKNDSLSEKDLEPFAGSLLE